MKNSRPELQKPIRIAAIQCPNCHKFRRVIFTHAEFDEPNRMWHWHYITEDGESQRCDCTLDYNCTIPKGADIRTSKAIAWKERT